MTETDILSCTDVRKHFEEAGQRLDVLKGVNLRVAWGETLAIIGESGSGKTTLLQILGGLDLPSSGDIRITGQSLASLSDAARGTLRNRALGFVYQFHHLLPEFSALENVAMPLLVRRTPVADAEREARWFLERVGLGSRLTHRPAQLSGGERQRAAVARALVTRPQLVLADEPTGNLDGRNARSVLELMLELNRELGTSLVLVTHSTEIAARMQRVLTLQDGQLLDT
jgi:lipoprotein-releasing system ATP-binding protein